MSSFSYLFRHRQMVVYFLRKCGTLIYVEDGSLGKHGLLKCLSEGQCFGIWILIASCKSKKKLLPGNAEQRIRNSFLKAGIKFPVTRIKKPPFQTAVKARVPSLCHTHTRAYLPADVNYDSAVLAWNSRVYRGESGEQVVRLNANKDSFYWMPRHVRDIRCICNFYSRYLQTVGIKGALRTSSILCKVYSETRLDKIQRL